MKLILQEDSHKEVIGGQNAHIFKLSCRDAEEGVYTVTLAPPKWIVV